MYCWKCGAPHVEGAEFCEQCGSPANPIHSKPDYSSKPANEDYAGFWIRFAAYFIDGILLAMLIVVGVLVLTIMFDTAVIESRLAAFVIMNIFFWLYFAGMESSLRKATLGKRAVGIVVVDDAGERISFGKASLRYFVKTFISSILLIGFFMAAFTNKKKALHDMLADTVVKYRREL